MSKALSPMIEVQNKFQVSTWTVISQRRRLGSALLNVQYNNYFDTINPIDLVPLNPEKNVNTDCIVQTSYSQLASSTIITPRSPKRVSAPAAPLAKLRWQSPLV